MYYTAVASLLGMPCDATVSIESIIRGAAMSRRVLYRRPLRIILEALTGDDVMNRHPIDTCEQMDAHDD